MVEMLQAELAQQKEERDFFAAKAKEASNTLAEAVASARQSGLRNNVLCCPRLFYPCSCLDPPFNALSFAPFPLPRQCLMSWRRKRRKCAPCRSSSPKLRSRPARQPP